MDPSRRRGSFRNQASLKTALDSAFTTPGPGITGGTDTNWRGDHARRDELPVADRADALEYGPRQSTPRPK